MNETLPQELNERLGQLRRLPGFAEAQTALREADVNDDNYLTYREYQSAQLSGEWRQRLSLLEAEVIRDYRDGDFGSRMQIVLRNDLAGVNAILDREGMPRVGMNFMLNALRANQPER